MDVSDLINVENSGGNTTLYEGRIKSQKRSMGDRHIPEIILTQNGVNKVIKFLLLTIYPFYEFLLLV